MKELVNAAFLLANLKASQWKSREELESLQEQRLRSLISYVSEHVPYYRKALRGVRMRGLEDLKLIPLTKKLDIRLHTDSFISDRFRRESLSVLSTSGSTGTPLNIYHHPSEAHYGPVFELHQLTEAGVGPFDLQAYLSPHAAHERLIQRLGIFRRCHLSPFLREKDILTSLKKLKPRALICLPSLLSTLAHENIVSGIGVSIDKIFSTSEVLSAKARAMMARAFGSEIYDMYGAMETSWIAWQCEKGSLHLHSDSIIAEIVDDGGNPVRDGGYGNIVLTPLLKRSMPLVRYYLGDRTAFGSRCACGRGLHVLKPIEGRDDDFIVLPSGRLSPARFIHWGIRDMPEVLLFQAIQEKSGELCIKIVPSGKSLSPSKAAEIVRNLKGSFPEPMEISVEQVESLPRGKTGKIQAVISKVRPSIGV